MTLVACTSNEEPSSPKVNNEPEKIKSSAPTGFSNRIIFYEDIGWGYQIFDDGKLVIDQKNIPAVQGNSGFQSKKDAEVICNYVIKKLERKEFPPSVSVAEMDSLLKE